MSPTAPFGRRGVPQSRPAQRLNVALTPAQRALLFGSDPLSDGADAPAPPVLAPAVVAPPVLAPRCRRAGMIACLTVTAVVVGMTLVGQPPAAALQQSDDWSGPLALVGSIGAIASHLGANLWLTQKLCCWRGWTTLAAYAATGAALSFLVAQTAGLAGPGETEIGPFAALLSGGGVALLYRLLTRRGAA